MDTPIEPNHKLEEALEDGTVNRGVYQWLVGKFIYVAHTRLSIAYVLSIVSYFIRNPKDSHLQDAYLMWHYLKGTSDKGLLFK